jgi:hypothetical protein
VLIVGGNQSAGGYNIDNSLRFDDGSSDYLSRTPASVSNRRTWTWSGWVKKSGVSVGQTLFGVRTGTTTRTVIRFVNNDTLDWIDDDINFRITTTNLYRDPSAWYHVVAAMDTTQATSTNRLKLYVNGEQVTSFSTATYPSQNYEAVVNNTLLHAIGREGSSSNDYFDGYMAEVCLIDGQQLDPTSFGEFDEDSGIWKPIPYTGSYGTNGFFLEFQNSAALGTDSSGNGNNFTVNNLTSVDQSTDTSTNNFCTANPLSKSSSITTANGNLSITMPSSTFQSAMATIAVDQGKWYWEQKVSSLGIINCGVTKSKQDGTTHSSVDAGRVMYSSNGNIYDEGFANSPIATGTTFTTNDIIGIALNLDAGTIGFYKNGSLIYTYSNAGLTTNEMTPAWGLYSATWDLNFGSPPFTISSGNSDADGYGNFEYAVPSGYYALCTKNLAEYG